MKVLTCTFDHNFAKTGGAIYNKLGTMEIQACVFDRNHAKLDGGALWNYRGTIKIQSCAFDNHHAGQDGGAVVLFKGTMEMHGCNITNCSAEVLCPSPAQPPACDNTPQLSPSPLACTETGRRNLHRRSIQHSNSIQRARGEPGWRGEPACAPHSRPLCRICVLRATLTHHSPAGPHAWLSTRASCAVCRMAAASLWCEVC